MIPETIHWIWLGDSDPGEKIKGYMSSWPSVLPSFKQKLWDNEVLDKFPMPPIVMEAVKQKKWSLASDYIRLLAVYNEGGVYLDTDIIMIKPFNSEMMGSGFFSCVDTVGEFSPLAEPYQPFYRNGVCMDHSYHIGISAWLFGSVPGHPFLKDCLEWYQNLQGPLFDMVLSYTVIAPFSHGRLAKKYGFQPKDEFQKLKENMVIYPEIYFGWSKVPPTSDLVFSFHMCNSSWFKDKGK